ncbi:Endochitinase B1 [Cytospora mali]|uniref:chitinase n=1 Tax=Cytospora mali TaxID=578113 RepID=A0A194UUL5_CYTMA|nr:Endochitinase B1 [Valsa mali var. pyri (nom. inval.)]
MPQFRQMLYLTAWNNHVPDISLLSRVTHVALAFVSSEALTGEPPTDWPLFENIKSIRARFAPGTKVLVAIGGWGDDKGFPEAAISAEARKQFASNVVKMLQDTGADGVDIDWQYPGGNGENYKRVPNSTKKWEIVAFPKLLSELRAALGPNFILSAAVPGLQRDMMAFNRETIPEINRALDFVNVTTYDLMNRRDTVTKHHAGISESRETIETYLKRGFPADKLNLGFAFHLKWFNTDPNERPLNAVGAKTVLMEDPKTGVDLGQSGALTWNNVPAEMEDPLQRAMIRGSYDAVGGGSFSWDAQDKRWWTWETPESIKRKFESLVVSYGLGGVFAWALGDDAPFFDHLRALDESVAMYESIDRHGVRQKS